MKKRMFERGLSLLLALVMVLALAPAFTIEVDAAEVTVNSLGELESAFKSADRIVVGTSFAITKDLTIPGNVTVVVPAGISLVLPCDSNASVNDSSAEFPYANAQELASTKVLNHPGNATAVHTVTMESGAVIEVSGVLAVGGQYSSAAGMSGQTAGLFSQIDMASDSVIDVKNGGVLSSVGYITGDGFVKLASGAKAYEPFIIADYQGGTHVVSSFHGGTITNILGTNSSNIGTENGVMPFNNFALFNIQASIEVNSGANLMGYCDLYTGKMAIIEARHNKTVVSVIGQENSIFDLDNGSVVVDYNAPNADSGITIGQTTMLVNGNMNFGYLALNVQVATFNVDVSSKKLFFSLPYTFKIVQETGTLKIPTGIKVKMMPGAEIIVNEGAAFEVAADSPVAYGTLIVYDGLDATSNPYYPAGSKLKAAGYAQHARLMMNGTMNLNGAVGGIVETGGSGVVNVGRFATLNDITSYEGVIAGWGIKGKVLFYDINATVSKTTRAQYTRNAQIVLHAKKYDATGSLITLEKNKSYYGVSAEPVYGSTTYSYVFDPTGAKTVKTGSYSGEVKFAGSWGYNTSVIYDNGQSLSHTAPVAAAGEILTWYADHTFTETVAAPATSGVVYYSMEKCEHEGCKHVGIDAVNHGYTCAACGLEVLEEHDWVDGSCTVCGFGQFNVDAETDRVVMIDAPAHSFAVAAAYDGEKMVLVGMNDNGSTSFVINGLESGMTVKIFLLDADYAPIADYVPVEKTAE